ncbi:ATP-binding protein [Candidatus Woesearchaeota archaeon]|nr:ATP-binding protein [Candidatus Woesearchaeota archaeon]
MEVNEVITKFQDFVEKNCQTELFENVRQGKHVLIIDFQELCKFNLDVSEELLDKPEETIKAFELAIKNFDLGENANDIKQITVRVKNLPKEQYILIRNIRSNHLGKFIWTEGVVRQKSDVRPQVTSARFECPSCGNIIPVLQLEKKFKEPSRCNCGRKGKFKMISKELVDAQGIVLEESTKDMEGGEQPKRINIFLKNDLVSPMSEKRTNPGNNIRVVGIIKEVPIILKTGGQSTKFDLLIEANCVEGVEEDYSNIEISAEDEERIKVLASDPLIYEKLTSSLAPGIFGHDRVKEALCMQFVGGVTKHREDGVKTRGDIHILLIGDPGCGKSQILKRASVVAPKARYVSGKGVSLEYNESLLIKDNNNLQIIKIGEFVDAHSENKENVFVPLKKNILALSLNNDTKKLEWKPISCVFRHTTDDKLLKFYLESGREVTVTKDHSIYTIENGKIMVKTSQELGTNDYVLIPKKIIIEDEKEPKIDINIDSGANDLKAQKNISMIDKEYARLLGYFIAEGHLHAKEKEYYKVEFTLGKKDTAIVKDLQNIVKNKFNKEISINKHGENGLRLVIHGKESYTTFVKLLGDVAHKHAKEKRIPQIIFNSNTEMQQEFIEAYIKGDAGVTKSKELASDLLYIFLYNKKIASLTKKFCDKITVINGRNVHNYGYVYELKSPKEGKQFDNRYERPPYKKFGEVLSNYFFKNVKTNKSTRITTNTLSNTMLLNRFCSIAQEGVVNGNELRKRFGESILEYIGEHSTLFNKQKEGRQIQVTITEEGDKLISELIDFVGFMNSDVGFVRIKKIEEVENKHKYVYDISVPENENFVAGFGGIICHNSGAGLTAAVVKDEFLSGWSLEAGAMVLANKGILMVDELDKMSPEDRDAMHEGLEQQSVSISKANIQATLRCETTVLAAANPKLGRFDPYGTIAGQIDLPPTLISRFDLIFPIKDLPDEEKDTQMAKFILELHKMRNTEEPDIPTELLRKYLVYAKQRMSPQLTDAAIEELRDYYVQMRSSGATEGKGIKTIPITARQLEGLVRLSEAYAKLRLGDKVTRKDAKKAKAMLEYCLQQVGMDPETGKIDIDRISTGVSTTERSRIVIVRELINELEETLGKNIPLQTVIDAAKEKGIEEDKTMELIEKMKRNGDLFEPKRGEIQKI